MLKKVIYVAFLICILAEQSFAHCYYLSCRGQVESGKTSSEAAITNAYEKLHASMDQLKEEYKKQLKELKQQNKLLEEHKALAKKDLLVTKQIIFLLNKYNKLQNNKNSIEGEQLK
ncbi:hypothetical protein ACOTVD_09055 [Campylobacter jejuni]|uniref:hypothetical protein n=1 Tax=Campylobacter TaxID=194 RepID=UPI000874FE1E|nr:hypothetical protein [Campylobacter sp. US12a]EAJ8747106.1 hypothetical protein [Campylobacter jejuni]MCW1355353.1 hypothetical protein [Campylobacter jejuni]OEV61777.1 hypothetical protein AJY73_10505 [Campylobacter jejuni]TEY04690.1 hypothetical protein ELQ15_08200 [Campylobacter sp. US12a]